MTKLEKFTIVTSETERWCRLNKRLEVGGERFEAGEIFRVARTNQRDDQEALLTLDGNEDSFHWSSALVIHNVPASAVTFLQDDASIAGAAGRRERDTFAESRLTRRRHSEFGTQTPSSWKLF